MSTFRPVRGMRDLLSKDAENLNSIIEKSRGTAKLFGYKEVITPIVEPFELLSAKSGQEIRQRMFTFEDMGGRKVALRPEFTASVARIVINALKNEPKPLRVFSVGSVYRYDEPQRGRYREFWQANFELMGSPGPEADAEVILLSKNLLDEAGLRDYKLKLGHVGILRAILSQEGVEDKIQNELLQKMDKREFEKGFRLVDEKCRKILLGMAELQEENALETLSRMRNYLKSYEKALMNIDNLTSIIELITVSGCEVENVDPIFARGLEYYTGMIFELYIPQLEIALGGGGRYDKLIEVFGGEPTPAVGMAMGIDRVSLALQAQKKKIEGQHRKRVMVIPIKPAQRSKALKIAQLLREANIPTEFEVMGRKMTKALEDADKRKMDYAIIVGEKELSEGKTVVKDLSNGKQTEVEISRLTEMFGN
jgi:histidyl-tRNA synthetase